MPGGEVRKAAHSSRNLRRIGGPLLVCLGLVAMPAAAQGIDDIDRSTVALSPSVTNGARPLAVIAEDRDYIIPFMALSDIETDFSLIPPTPDEIIRDASIVPIDAPFEARQAKK